MVNPSSASPDDELDRLARQGMTRQQVEAGEDCLDPEVLASYAESDAAGVSGVGGASGAASAGAASALASGTPAPFTGGLSAAERMQVEAHLAVCGWCRRALALEREAALADMGGADEAGAISTMAAEGWRAGATGQPSASSDSSRAPGHAPGRHPSVTPFPVRRALGSSVLRTWLPLAATVLVTTGLWFAFGPAARDAARPDAPPSSLAARRDVPAAEAAADAEADADARQRRESTSSAKEQTQAPPVATPPSSSGSLAEGGASGARRGGSPRANDAGQPAPPAERFARQGGQSPAASSGLRPSQEGSRQVAPPSTPQLADTQPAPVMPAPSQQQASGQLGAALQRPARQAELREEPSQRAAAQPMPGEQKTAPVVPGAAPPPASAAGDAAVGKAAAQKVEKAAGTGKPNAAGGAAPAAVSEAITVVTAPATAARVVGPAAMWRVTAPGTIDTSRDGGATWTTEISRTDRRIAAVDSARYGGVWAVGANGLVMRRTGTDHPGWQDVAPPTPRDLVSVTVTSVLSAVVTDDQGRTYRTRDGGRSWQSP